MFRFIKVKIGGNLEKTILEERENCYNEFKSGWEGGKSGSKSEEGS